MNAARIAGSWVVVAGPLVVVWCVLVRPGAVAGEQGPAAPNVHPCAGAGRWFPDDPRKLREACDGFMAGDAAPIPQAPIAIISPHAGYQFSGAVAGRGYAVLKGRPYARVILLGPSHRAYVRGASVLRADAYDTPLGRIPVDAAVRDTLLKTPGVSTQPAAHASEHSVENQLPFLQAAIGPFKMIELLVGDMAEGDRAVLAAALRPLLTDGTLLVVSSDFSHYGPSYGYVPFKDNVPDQLRVLNDLAAQEILQVDLEGWAKFLSETRDTICGQSAIGLLLKVLEPMDDVQGLRVAFDTSGRQLGDYTNSVTYASFVFWRGGAGLSEAEQQALLRIARDAVRHFLKAGKAPEFDAAKANLTPALKAPGAVFVTLKNKDDLRGCIGHIVAYRPLYLSVIENACNACRDPRFTAAPITEKEGPQLTVDISVLTPMRRLTDPQQVRVGKDGLMMARGRARGVLLPQVPTEQGWNREQFLEATCRKAGLPSGAWKDKDTEIYRFSAQVFSDKPEEKK
jgi:hypothetical protein